MLQDIDGGLKEAEQKTGRKYYVEISSSGGVSFDAAVTVINSTSGEVKGKGGISLIEVVSANIAGGVEKKMENTEVSRIQFTVHVPQQTQDEIKQEEEKIEARKPSWANQDPYKTKS